MISKRISFLFLLVSFCSLTAQDIRLCYEHDYDAATQTDTLRIYLKGDADTTLSIRAANISVAFHDSCATFDTLYSYFTGSWSPFFEQIRVSNGLSLSRKRRTYSSRLQYGNSDPGIPMDNPVPLPGSDDDSLLIFEFVFQGSCSQKLYIENQAENPLNQFGDSLFNEIEYAYYACQGQDSVVFCVRQARDSVAMRDSLRLFMESNPRKRIGLSELTFSVAFRDSCADYDSLYTTLNSMWGDTLSHIELQDSLQLTYDGKPYDSRLIYRHQNPNFSSTNLLLTPSQARFPEWVSTFFFSGSCSQDLYIENQADRASNLMLNQLDEPLLYAINRCDSLPEDTLVLDIPETTWSGWRIFPNPASSQLFIQPPASGYVKSKIQLLDMQGKIREEKVLPYSQAPYPLSVVSLPAGMYLLKVQHTTGEMHTFTFIKK